MEIIEQKANILVVDDTPENRNLLRRLLEHNGYGVYTATDGASALEKSSSELPDMILLDIAMPDMDGYEVCKRLKENESLKDIPVIFISALDDMLDKVKKGVNAGVDGLIFGRNMWERPVEEALKTTVKVKDILQGK